jgi:hypothetical protein
MCVIVFHNADTADALPRSSAQQSHTEKESNVQYLEYFNQDEDLGVFEIDGPSTRNARYDSIYDCLPRNRIVVANFELDLVLHHT